MINAICHRNYTDPGMVQVRIYDDRLEVWNPGMLPPDLTIEQLYHEHASHPRNPRLAGAFHHTGLVERWGTGTLRIITACLGHGIGRPDFVTESGMFIVRFRVATVTAKPSTAKLDVRLQQAVEFIQARGGSASKNTKSTSISAAVKLNVTWHNLCERVKLKPREKAQLRYIFQ